jgi:RNA polymerase-binding transcription factor DksA
VTKSEVSRYRRNLESLAHRLRAEVGDLREESTHREAGQESTNYPVTTQVADERIAAKAEGEVLMQLLDNEEHLLAEVQAALRRIDAGIYGKCIGCQKPISKARLDAIPYTPLCITCADSVG